MNVFQGEFPGTDTGLDGWVGTCPVGSYPANDLGLFETTGNVWEWCADWFDASYYETSPRTSPAGPATGTAKVMRGGSYLCHESYCWRYRVDSRSSNTPRQQRRQHRVPGRPGSAAVATRVLGLNRIGVGGSRPVRSGASMEVDIDPQH